MALMNSSTSEKLLLQLLSRTCTIATRISRFSEVLPGTTSAPPSQFSLLLTLPRSGVPGELRGLEHLHNNYGKLPWAHIMKPAINVARSGFTVTQDLINQMNSATAGQDNFLVNNPTWAIDFAPNGTRVALGQTITRKRYADTLEVISQQGPNAFYTGAIANATITALKAAGGTMRLADLKNYTVVIRKPAQITYRGFKLTSCSAPSSGVVAMSVMKTVEGYQEFGYASTLNLSTHRFDEAIRFGYGEVRVESFLTICCFC